MDVVEGVKPAAPAPAPMPPASDGVELTDEELDKVAGGAGAHHEMSKNSIGNLRA
jgi:mersacidin/lichenicidin family type 2 lantibiotic